MQRIHESNCINKIIFQLQIYSIFGFLASTAVNGVLLIQLQREREGEIR